MPATTPPARRLADEGPAPANLAFAEHLYEAYRRAPDAVAPAWRRWFEALDDEAAAPAPLEVRVDRLVHAWRTRGHLVARLDPLGRTREAPPELDPSFWRLGPAELDQRFTVDPLTGGRALPLRDILDRLRAIYGGSIGVRSAHIEDRRIRRWLLRRLEAPDAGDGLDRATQLRILARLTDAVILEAFLRRKFPGSKSFSLEGAESLIPLLDLAIERAAAHGVTDVVLGMAHRGRLDVLVNVIGKSPAHVFREFLDDDPLRHLGRGDVKYHQGFSGDWSAASMDAALRQWFPQEAAGAAEAGATVHLTLAFNPSHLEFVDPVVAGRARARQDRAGDPRRVMALVIHGDAAMAGEGVVAETLNLSRLPAYATGGTLHVVVNNQLGFTTPPEQGRSSRYATDVCRMLPVPIFHVNGEDPEAVARAVRLALDFRAEHGADVVLDMYAYRRHGHNEGDEPTFTQPRTYAAIRARPGVREGYLGHLLRLGQVTREEADAIERARRAALEAEYERAMGEAPVEAPPGPVRTPDRGGPERDVPDVDTGVPADRLRALVQHVVDVPDGFRVHPKIERYRAHFLETAEGARPVGWAVAEQLAFATLATEGTRVRLTGQDTERGTFSQRHAVWHDVETGATHTPLAHLGPDQAPVEIANSPLSEMACLGFEYGYSLDAPDALVLWEAQFGDFANAAQVYIDQFVAAAEDKWRRLSGLVLLLPHAFEGQGPEHSSARLERFLTLAAEDNMQVVYPTTPAQYFHVLRRQVRRPWRKPLVVMTPKSLLRHPRSVSALDELATGRFRRVIGDARRGGVRRVLACSGKVYYDLEAHREEKGIDDVAIVRLEQLYPLPRAELREALSPYGDAPLVWVQEEPENMGAWMYLHYHLGLRAGVYRRASASPATGSRASHLHEQARLIEQAFSA